MSSMKAIWRDEVIAEAPISELIRIEGNWYFPPKYVKWNYMEDSDHRTVCPWKGDANYYDIIVDGSRNDFGAWYYAEPKETAIERVKHNFSNYVAFWNGVEVVTA